MSQPRIRAEDALKALASEKLDDGQHPAPEELIAFQAGTLEETNRSALREHLTWCTDCARTVLDLGCWPNLENRSSIPDLTADEQTKDWDRIRRHLDDSESSPAEEASKPWAVQATAADPSEPGILVPLWSAALICLMLAALTFNSWWQHFGPSEPDYPIANLLVVDLHSDTSGTRGISHTMIPKGMSTVVFLLVRSELSSFASYEAELSEGPEEEVIWRAKDLVSPPEGAFTVALPLKLMNSDRIVIQLYGIEKNHKTLVGTYQTRLTIE